MRRRKYHKYHVTDLRCVHRQIPEGQYYSEPSGYCDDCWRAALARGLTAEEWEELHAQAAVSCYGKPPYKPFRPYRLPATPKAAQAWKWNGTAAERQLTITIEQSTAEEMRGHVLPWIGRGAYGYRIVACDGHRMLATPGLSSQGTGATGYLNPSVYTWADLPTGTDLAVRRVLTCANERSRAIRLTLLGTNLEIRSSNGPDGCWARELVRVPLVYCPAVEVCVNGDWLVEVLRGALQLGMHISSETIMLRPASDAWRYVQMGMRL